MKDCLHNFEQLYIPPNTIVDYKIMHRFILFLTQVADPEVMQTETNETS